MSENIAMSMTSESELLIDARKIIDTARSNAVRSVDFNRVMMYWNLGKRILEEEQHGKDRAEYGARIIRDLAVRLEAEYGSGFGVRQLDQSRKFYRLYPIAHTLCAQLNWSQYKLLISIEESDAVVKMSLPEDNQTILAAEYKLRLPTEEQLLAEVRKATEEWENNRSAE